MYKKNYGEILRTLRPNKMLQHHQQHTSAYNNNKQVPILLENNSSIREQVQKEKYWEK